MKVKIDILFSRNKKIGSKFIAWGTNHLSSFKNTPSHVAILVNDRWIHESTLETGVRIISFDKWKELNEEVHRHSYPIEYSYDHLKTMYREIKDMKYDWCGVLYFGFYLALNKFFKYPIPKINKWQSNNKYFCCEVVGEFSNIEYDMTSPVQLLEELRGQIERTS